MSTASDFKLTHYLLSATEGEAKAVLGHTDPDSEQSSLEVSDMEPDQAPPPDWSTVPEDVARLILEQGERHLNAQMSSALASDQRAMTAAAILIGFAAAIVAAGIAASDDVSLLVAALVGGALMLIGAGMCAYAARPTDFYFPGNHPNRWWPVANEPVSELIGGETENYQWMISENEEILSANERWLKRGLILSSLAPVVGVVCWFLISAFSFPEAASPASSPTAYLVPESALKQQPTVALPWTSGP